MIFSPDVINSAFFGPARIDTLILSHHLKEIESCFFMSSDIRIWLSSGIDFRSFFLLSSSIFATRLEKRTIIGFAELLNLYGRRWAIEMSDSCSPTSKQFDISRTVFIVVSVRSGISLPSCVVKVFSATPVILTFSRRLYDFSRSFSDSVLNLNFSTSSLNSRRTVSEISSSILNTACLTISSMVAFNLIDMTSTTSGILFLVHPRCLIAPIREVFFQHRSLGLLLCSVFFIWAVDGCVAFISPNQINIWISAQVLLWNYLLSLSQQLG